MLRKILLISLLVPCFAFGTEQSQRLKSPDGALSVTFSCEPAGMEWSVERKDGLSVIAPSKLGLSFLNAPEFGKNLLVESVERREVDEPWVDNFGKMRNVENSANEMYIELREARFPGRSFGICFRVYNEGVAFRYFLPSQTASLCRTIIDENTEFAFSDDKSMWSAMYPSYSTGQEVEYLPVQLSEIGESTIVGMPLLSRISDDCYALITEANIDKWGGMYLNKKAFAQNKLRVKVPVLPGTPGVNAVGESPRGQRIRLSGDTYSPWRVVMVASNPGVLHESAIIKNLNEPSVVEDTSWIKPGLCIWDDWWSNNTKMDTKSIKRYIDFAADNGIPYQLIDWRWYGKYNNPKADITKPDPTIDMPYLIDYANSRGVKIWLWSHYNDFVRNPEALAVYEEWGVAGVKIDFMNRDDQLMVDWYKNTLELAAKHHIMLNFHGAYKPDGLSRTYPNLLTRESVLGNEYNKNSSRVTPDHNVMLAYTRALIGPMDYTPGGFLNRGMGDYSISTPTQVQGTRNHQMALFVVYESPVTTLCDSPENYTNAAGFDFVKEVPCVWNKTHFVCGEMGEYICIARQDAQGRWFVSAINNSVPREITLNLDFLGKGKFVATQYSDDSDDVCSLNKTTKKGVRNGDVIKASMVAGGGFNMIIE